MQIKVQNEEFQDYLTDASNMPGGHADRLFLPESTKETADVLREASENGTSVTVSGARTGTVGGAIPFGGSVVSLERLNKIELNKDAKRVKCGAGTILIDVQKAADAAGLFYPPDPTEWSCQIGGTIATNASGARSFKYGATREFVEALTIVLANGDILNIRRGDNFSDSDGNIELTSSSGSSVNFKVPTYIRPEVRKNVSGYFNKEPLDAIDIFIGSEGTLGVITECELSLTAKHEGFFSGIVFFRDQADLLKFVDAAKALSFQTRSANTEIGVDASLLEYFDANSLKFIHEKFPETPENMAGAIFFEQETTAETEDELLEKWNELLEKHSADVDRSWFTTTEGDAERLREFRHALPVAVNERVVRNGQKKIGTDMSVPDDKFANFLKFYKDTFDRSGLEYVVFGHIGDNHLHANLLPKNADEAIKAKHLYGRCVAQAIMLGGTVSAEHGIGKLKRHYLYVMMGERYLNEMAEIKRAFDPKGILGRGNMFDEKYIGG
jgi:D-lactate dehydrogenase (cytochrome)